MLTPENKLINPEVRIETTNKCNTHCISCPRDKMTRFKMTMCYSRFCDLATQAKELGAEMISPFGYGEPLMDRELASKIAFVSDWGMDTFITTNGSLLNSDMAFDLLEAGLKNIRFSFHATNSIDYQKIHRLDFINVIANFREFCRLNDKAGHKCKVHITAMPLSNESVSNVVATWQPYCDFLEIWRPHNWGGAKNFRDSTCNKRMCGRPFSGPVQIQCDGTMIPCCFITNSEIVLGDTNIETIAEALRNERYKEFRKKHLIDELEGLPCATCDQRNIGDSPLLYSNRDANLTVGLTSTCKQSVR